jgi:hypothetical protein
MPQLTRITRAARVVGGKPCIPGMGPTSTPKGLVPRGLTPPGKSKSPGPAVKLPVEADTQTLNRVPARRSS